MKRLVGTAIGLGVIAFLLCIPAFFYGSGEVDAELRGHHDHQLRRGLRRRGERRPRRHRDDHRRLPGLRQARHLPVLGHRRRQRAARPAYAGGHLGHPRRQRRAVRAELRGPRPPPGGQDRRRPTRTLDVGEHTYVIKYHIDGVLDENDEEITGEDVDTMFYWQLIPRRLAAEHRRRPRSPSTCRCRRRPTSSARSATTPTTGCTAEGGGTKDLTVTTGPIADRTPVTIATGLDMETPPEGNSLPWTGRWDRVLSTHLPLLVIVLLAGLGALGFGSILGAKSREKPPGFPVLYAPPEGIGPAQAKYIYSETVDRTTYVATLMHAAEKGAVDLTRGERHLDHHRQGRAGGLGRARPGDHRHRPHPRRPGLVVHGQQEGRLGGLAAQGRDRAVRQQRRDLGQDLRQHGQQRARRPRRPAGPRRLRADARRARSGTPSR